MRKVVFDIESQNIFMDVGTNNPADLDLSVIALYDSLTDEYKAYSIDELDDIWPTIEGSDILIGFNSDHFDIPLLNKYYKGDLTKHRSLDILREIKKTYGRRMKLDQIAEGTLGTKKSGHGLQATAWWKRGEVEKIKKYCIDDVKITKEIYDFAIKNNFLKFKEGGQVLQINLDTSLWEKEEDTGFNQSLF
ncbi:MAG: ribonuclease H-like domain-containing protein [Candidatus Pacebacteria bacterium]|nr:ribonuclease H-like domain-containing protein [Candidatus Paceibacterota bacterium]